MSGEQLWADDATPADARRAHPAWSQLAQHQRRFCERLLSLGATWHGQAPRDEYECALLVTSALHALDEMAGSLMVAVWWALLNVDDVERSAGSVPSEWGLSAEAPAAYRGAEDMLAAVRARGAVGQWDGGDPAVRRRLEVLRGTLEAMTAGYQIVDPLRDVGRGAPPTW